MMLQSTRNVGKRNIPLRTKRIDEPSSPRARRPAIRALRERTASRYAASERSHGALPQKSFHASDGECREPALSLSKGFAPKVLSQPDIGNKDLN